MFHVKLFFPSAPLGSKVIVTAEVDKIGERLAFASCKITSEDGKVIALGGQTKLKTKL